MQIKLHLNQFQPIHIDSIDWDLLSAGFPVTVYSTSAAYRIGQKVRAVHHDELALIAIVDNVASFGHTNNRVVRLRRTVIGMARGVRCLSLRLPGHYSRRSRSKLSGPSNLF